MQSRAAALETAVVIGAAVVFPLAWPLGRLLYRWLVRRVEVVRACGSAQGLWSVPITALAWIGAVLVGIGAVVIDPSAASTLAGVVVPSWIVAQGTGMFVMASAYGVLEGWVAVPGERRQWAVGVSLDGH